jgi:hypothetical protein
MNVQIVQEAGCFLPQLCDCIKLITVHYYPSCMMALISLTCFVHRHIQPECRNTFTHVSLTPVSKDENLFGLRRALAALQVDGSRDRSPVISLRIFSWSFDSSMCPGVDSASENEYQDTPGGKDGRCIRVTTLPPS